MYTVYNAPMATTAAMAKVTTGTAIKTMSQLATPSTRQIQIIAWGFTIDDLPASDSIVELLDTDVAATVTAHVASGVQNTDPNGAASLLTLGTSATGYSASAEGAVANTRTHGVKLLGQTAGETDSTWSYQFMPDERPIVAVSRFLRVRATMGSAVDMLCWTRHVELG
jgi:hypothetical protein